MKINQHGSMRIFLKTEVPSGDDDNICKCDHLLIYVSKFIFENGQTEFGVGCYCHWTCQSIFGWPSAGGLVKIKIGRDLVSVKRLQLWTFIVRV